MEGQVQCSHILQKHIKSRNPNDSYRKKKITRTPEEAMENIIKIRAEIVEWKVLGSDVFSLKLCLHYNHLKM